MKNSVDLSKFNIRTDLIIDDFDKEENQNHLDRVKYDYKDIHISRIKLSKENSKQYNKDPGIYVTIEFPDITNYENKKDLEDILEKELKNIYKYMNIKDNDNCLIIGLGNEKSTPDSLGPKVLNRIMVTRHLFLLANSEVSEGVRNVSIFTPNVMGNTGIESADIINNVVKSTNPKFLIAIDALASNSISRINRTIQITDSGIHPGSGIGNNRKEISKKTIGIPVIAIGIPTVTDASTVIGDTINYLYKHISYIKSNYNQSKLTYTRKNYIEKLKNKDLTKEEKKEVGGLLGELDEYELKELFDEVLTSIDYNMMVTVKEIDFIIEKLSDIVSSSLNKSLHKNFLG